MHLHHHFFGLSAFSAAKEAAGADLLAAGLVSPSAHKRYQDQTRGKTDLTGLKLQ